MENSGEVVNKGKSCKTNCGAEGRQISLCTSNESRSEIDIKEAVGLHESFLSRPKVKSMFAPDGAMFHCSFESALMLILEKEVVKSSGETATSTYRAELKCHTELQ